MGAFMEKYGPIIVPLMMSFVLVIGAWFTIEARLGHLEVRLTGDEQMMIRNFEGLEQRVHTLELDTSARLASIEATLVSIEKYIIEINAELNQRFQSNQGARPGSNNLESRLYSPFSIPDILKFAA